MIAIPEELDDMIEYNDQGEMILKENASEEQKKVFEQLLKDLDEGDTSIVFEP